ncbi:hypothetical protein ZWY2020_055576 [Hordeum vulgare]|nr:hypothetical protein ZWY2020_055576 [Hordeum vulgare]
MASTSCSLSASPPPLFCPRLSGLGFSSSSASAALGKRRGSRSGRERLPEAPLCPLAVHPKVVASVAKMLKIRCSDRRAARGWWPRMMSPSLMGFRGTEMSDVGVARLPQVCHDPQGARQARPANLAALSWSLGGSSSLARPSRRTWPAGDARIRACLAAAPRRAASASLAVGTRHRPPPPSSAAETTRDRPRYGPSPSPRRAPPALPVWCQRPCDSRNIICCPELYSPLLLYYCRARNPCISYCLDSTTRSSSRTLGLGLEYYRTF